MKKYTNKEGDTITLDNANNLFMNNKCLNPLRSSKYSIEEQNTSVIAVAITELTPKVNKVEAIGHVPNFTYGQGDDKVTINTGQKAW